MRILHIDDDSDFRKWIKQALTRAGHAVDNADNAKMGLQLARETNYDLLLLDIGMPDITGLTLLTQLRQAGITSAIFMISGQGGVEEKVMAFRDGADDYLVKPVLIEELVARIQRWFRNRNGATGIQKTAYKAGNLTMDVLKRRVTVNGKVIATTPKEFSLLECLLRNQGRVVTQQALAEAVWNLDYETGTNVVEVHIKRLRDKIAEESKPSIIQTVRGSGYLIDAEIP